MASVSRSPSTPCCTREEQASCCEPSEKDGCCSPGSSGCECAPGQRSDATQVREQVRARYAAAARAAAAGARGGCGCAVGLADENAREVFGGSLYDPSDAADARDAVAASLGCGVPIAVADLRPGEIVLDLGCGAGADVVIAAGRVGPSGKAIGLDMTDEMLELARANAERSGVANVEFRKGYVEQIPLAAGSVDVVISNCVLNLSADKPRVTSEAARVLRPGGRLAICDVIADPDMEAATRRDMRQWTGCIGGALTALDFERALSHAGLHEIEITETHRVHERAAAAIIRARKPSPA